MAPIHLSYLNRILVLSISNFRIRLSWVVPEPALRSHRRLHRALQMLCSSNSMIQQGVQRFLMAEKRCLKCFPMSLWALPMRKPPLPTHPAFWHHFILTDNFLIVFVLRRWRPILTIRKGELPMRSKSTSM